MYSNGINSKAFAEGKVEKVLLRFAFPAIISLLVSELYGMVDTFYVGRYVGPNAIGALTIAFPIQRLLSSTGLLIAAGACTKVAKYFGEKDYENLKITITNAIILTVAVMTLMPLIIYIFMEPILFKSGASSVTLPMAKTYTAIILIGGIFQGLTFVTCYIINSLGNPKVTLYATSLGAVFNIIIDAVLVINYNMGVKGAAIATVVSQIAACTFAMYNFYKVARSINLKNNFSIDIEILKSIIAIGFTTFIIEISDAIVAVVLNNVLFAHGGDRAVIVSGTIMKVSMLMYVNIIGIASAMQPMVAFNYGAKNFKRLKETIRKTLKVVILTSVFLWAIMMLFAEPIIGSFVKDEALMKECTRAYRIMISIFPTIGLYYISIYVYQAMGEAKMSFLLSIYRQLVLFIPIVLIFVKHWSVIGAWLAYPATDVIAAITGFIYIRRVKEDINEYVDRAEAARLIADS
ncbi:MATE family efflux transporter [Tepidanaerobacter acetatoxydans]|uniref:MATE family efflux transporter n=1 Tax=Tepidanaerobacter acetatoxydans TaxID=499229 RepID=UPI001BD57678